MWQLFIVTFFDWWEIQFDQVWSSLIHFGRIWSKKIKNKTAIFILFKNVTTLYTNIFWYVQPLKSFFSDRRTDRRKPHRHRSSNSSLDYQKSLVWKRKRPKIYRLNSKFKVKIEFKRGILSFRILLTRPPMFNNRRRKMSHIALPLKKYYTKSDLHMNKFIYIYIVISWFVHILINMCVYLFVFILYSFANGTFPLFE